MPTLHVLANCQTGGLKACLSLLLPSSTVTGSMWSETDAGIEAAAQSTNHADVVITSAPPRVIDAMIARHGYDRQKSFSIPSVFFQGFDPDVTYASAGGKPVRPVSTSPYNSAIGVWCWRRGMSVEETASYFTADTIRRLGYDRSWSISVAQSRAHFQATRIPFADFFLPLQTSGERFMHTSNHPDIRALATMARLIAKSFGLTEDAARLPLHHLIPDALAHEMTWPIYPGLGEALGLESYLTWRIYGQLYDLESFLDAQFSALSSADGEVVAPGADDPGFNARMREITGR